MQADIPRRKTPPYCHSSVSFSECGTYLALFYREHATPDLHHLDNLIPFSAQLQHAIQSSHISSSSQSTNHNSTTTSEDVDTEEIETAQTPASHLLDTLRNRSVAERLNMHKNIASPNVAVVKTRGGETAILALEITSSEIRIRRAHATEESVTSLVQLPQSFPSHGMQAQVTMPDPEEERPMYQVILNAAPPKTFRSDQPIATDMLPLVVRKDPSALRPATVLPLRTPQIVFEPETAEKEDDENDRASVVKRSRAS